LQPGPLSRVINSKRVKNLEYGNRLADALHGFDVIFCSLFPTHLWVARARRRNSTGNGPVVWYLQEPSRKYYWKITDPHLLDHRRYCGSDEQSRHLSEYAKTLYKHDHDRRQRRQIAWDRKALRHIDLILANSKFSAQNISRAFERQVEVCYPGIPTDSEPLKAPGGDYMLAVARFSVRKNVQNIIEAFHVLSRQHGRDDIPLKIVGQGPCWPELETLVQQKGLGGHVEFLGFLNDRQLAEAYQKARLSIYLPIDEPFGLIAVESMYRGVPPIVSDHGGLAEIVVHGETGLHVNPFDPEKIADAVVSLWDDEKKIGSMARAGRNRVENHFTSEHLLGRIERFLLQVQETRGDGARG
jgi:glycosyltransferase involved in cell wall biosynthesis